MTHAEAKAINAILDKAVLEAVEETDLPPEEVCEYGTQYLMTKWEES